MSGFFGVVSKNSCVEDLFYGTDYHSHLGTRRAGMAVIGKHGFARFIHNITTHPFRSKFEHDIAAMEGNKGIVVISDFENQPLIINSHLEPYAIVTVSKINNMQELKAGLCSDRKVHFTESMGEETNPTELIAALIHEGADFVQGIQFAQESISGSCSLLLLTRNGIYAARDKFGRTPIVIGKKDGAFAATLETCAFPNLGFNIDKYLGPGEIVFLSPDGCEQKALPKEKMRICSFLWIYYGYPPSCYEGICVEEARNRCGAALARNDDVEIDFVAGIPDSGTGHGLGYAAEKRIAYKRPLVKYTPTWPRSFMPPDEKIRALVAKMKLIPVKEIMQGKRILFCEDSIVRGTQLRDNISFLFELGAREVHMRPACPPLIFGCKFLNFSRSKSELDLAGRKAIVELEAGKENIDFGDYLNPETQKYKDMADRVRRKLGLTTLKYQRLEDMVGAIGLPEEKLCTYCWTGEE